jgi:hypothetical protein
MIARPPVRTLLRELAGRAHHDPHDETVRLAVRLRAGVLRVRAGVTIYADPDAHGLVMLGRGHCQVK